MKLIIVFNQPTRSSKSYEHHLDVQVTFPESKIKNILLFPEKLLLFFCFFSVYIYVYLFRMKSGNSCSSFIDKLHNVSTNFNWATSFWLDQHLLKIWSRKDNLFSRLLAHILCSCFTMRTCTSFFYMSVSRTQHNDFQFSFQKKYLFMYCIC